MIGQKFIGFVAVFSWMPFLLLCAFLHPLGTHEWDWISNWAGKYDTWKLLAVQEDLYLRFGGRYSSNFLLSLTSSWYSLTAFRWLFVGNLALLFAATSYLLRQALPFLKRGEVLGLAALCWGLYFEASSNVYEDLYCFTVVLIYQLGLVGNLLVAGLLVRLRQQEKLSKKEVFSLWLLLGFTAGLNEISLVFLILSLGAYLVAQRLDRRKIPYFMVLLAVFLLFCAWLIVVSPGNSLRAEATGGSRHIGKILVATVGASGFLWLQWVGSSLLIPAVILLLPAIGNYRAKLKDSRIFGRPWLWLAALLALLPLVWTPVFYGSGLTLFPERIVDMLYFAFLLCFFATLVSFLLQEKWAFYKAAMPMPFLSVLVGIYFILRLFLGDIFFDKEDRSPDKSHWSRIQISSNIGRAWISLLSGAANSYSSGMQQQYTDVLRCDGDPCQVEKPSVFPFPLYDPLYDRRDDLGDPYLCWFFHGRPCWVRYREE